MIKIFSFLILSTIFLGGCHKKDQVKTSGEATLNSDRILEGSTYTIQGFSLVSGEVVSFNPESTQNIPDLFVLPIADQQGNVTGAFFDSPNIYASFALVDSFSDAKEALNFFNNYREVKVDSYTELATPLQSNQVWVFKTNAGKFSKLLILDVQFYLKDITPYAEVKFKWAYQPDGSMRFSN